MKALLHIREYFFGSSPLRTIEQYATDGAVRTAALMVRAYYYFLLFLSVGLFSAWEPLAIGAQAEAVRLWPVMWLPYVDAAHAYAAIRLFFIAASAYVAFFPHHRIARVLSCVALFEFVSLYATILQLDVDGYGLLLVSLTFIFLPAGIGQPEALSAFGRSKLLLVFFAAQAETLLTYTMGGLGKFVGAAQQALVGLPHYFVPDASALLIADRLVLTRATSALGPWAIDHYWIVLPYFLFTVYLLTVSILVAFRPRLHYWWGVLLLIFHIGNYLVINIAFATHIFLVAILFLSSPFTRSPLGWRALLKELPFVDIVVRKWL